VEFARYDFARGSGGDERPGVRAFDGAGKSPKNAVLYALDSSTGKEIWSSGTTATSYATGGIAIDASMVLFATHDSQVHAYGIPILF
jgi:outer membrane protein assembly factor BamB